MADFERRLRQSSFFAVTALSADEYAERIRTVVTGLLDEMALLRQCRPRMPKPDNSQRLSRDAVLAKRLRRRQERRWRRTGQECDRVADSNACRWANKLITSSRASHFRM